MSRRPGLLLSSTIVALVPATASADGSWRLTWRAPSECPAAADVERRIGALLGDAPASPPLHVTATVERDGDEWKLRMVARRDIASQTRVLRHRDCASLGEATALLVALAVDPVGTVIDPRMASLLRAPAEPRPVATQPRAQPVSREPEPWVGDPPIDPPAERALPEPLEPVVVPPPEPEVAPAPSPTPAPRRRIVRGAALRVAGGIAAGPTPGVAGGVVAAAALGLGRLARVELTGSFWAPTRARLASAGPGVGADISLTTGGLRGCLAPGRGIVEIPLCVGFELGSMRARGVGVSQPGTPRSLWAAATFGVALAIVPIPRLAVWLAGDGHLALERPTFLIENGGEVWRAAPGGIRATLGIELRFGVNSWPRP